MPSLASPRQHRDGIASQAGMKCLCRLPIFCCPPQIQQQCQLGRLCLTGASGLPGSGRCWQGLWSPMQGSGHQCQHFRINKAARRLGEGGHGRQEWRTGVSGAADTKGLLSHPPASSGSPLPRWGLPGVQ